MPFSYWPLIFSALLIGVPVLILAKGRRTSLYAAAVSVSILVLLFLCIYIPGWALIAGANRGNPAAMYELARWTERHDEQIGQFIPWPFSPDVLGGYAWLEKAAARDFPPAVYALGVRLKQGNHVPRPPDWEGPGGNHFPQPERGQKLIDKAIELGYQPTIPEEYFYSQQYRK